jgi:hypothetical protein
MSIYTINSTSILNRFMCLILLVTLIIPSISFSQPYSNPDPVVLGTAGNYRALAGTALSIGSGCTVTGNVGGTSVTNGGTVTGTTDVANSAVNTALNDLTAAIANINARAPNTSLVTVELSGLTLGRGIYGGPGTFGINGTLTLNGTADDIFIFRMSTTLITGSNCIVNLTGGALASNVFWQVGSAATIAGDFKGNILAGTYITQNSGTIDGKTLGLTAVTLGGASVLPVELTSFTATLNNSAVVLNWNTATEVNNYGFEVQRSQILSDATSESQIFNWTKIGFVKGAGNSSSPKNYLFIDNTVSYGSYAYRLKQLDNDGNYKYSYIIEVNTGQIPNGFLLKQNYPNPFNPSTEIQFSVSKNTHATLTIFNVIGEKVSTLFNDNIVAGQVYNITFKSDNLTSGIYFYELQTNEKSEVKKMLLMK